MIATIKVHIISQKMYNVPYFKNKNLSLIGNRNILKYNKNAKWCFEHFSLKMNVILTLGILLHEANILCILLRGKIIPHIFDRHIIRTRCSLLGTDVNLCFRINILKIKYKINLKDIIIKESPRIYIASFVVSWFYINGLDSGSMLRICYCIPYRLGIG